MPINFDHTKLRSRIREVFQSESKFAKALGISPAAVSMKLNGKIDFTIKEVKASCKALKIEFYEVTEYFFDLKS